MAHINASGSSDPATFWADLEPAMDRLLKAPLNDITGEPPTIDYALYTKLYTACFNLFTSQYRLSTDVYSQLDKYFAQACVEIVLRAPLEDITLIEYIIQSFNRFHLGARSVDRLLNYVNRHYVEEALYAYKGWLDRPVREEGSPTITLARGYENSRLLLRDQQMEQLKREWGAREGDSLESLAFAQSCAEAGSTVDRIVPVLSMAHRRFRTEIIEDLLAKEDRLARAVKELLESKEIDDEKRNRLASELAKVLQVIGIRKEHILRKELDEFLAAFTPENPESLAATIPEKSA